MQRSLARSITAALILIVVPFSVLASASPYAPASASLSESVLATATLTPTPANVFYIGQAVPGLTVQHDGCWWTCSQSLSVTYTGSGNVAGFVVRERAVMTYEGAPPWDDTWIRGYPFGSYGGGVVHGEGWRENCYSNGYPGYTRVDVCSSVGYAFRDGIVQSEILASGGSTVNMVFSVTGHPANVGYYEVAEIRVIYYGIPPTPTATPAATDTPTATSTPVPTVTPTSTPTTPPVSISITDPLGNPIPNNALALKSLTDGILNKQSKITKSLRA